MKTLNKLWGAGLLALILMLVAPQKSKAQDDGAITFQTFYDELSPYGIWIDDPDYGSVWVPDVDGDFRPYGTNGHWIVTSYGNTWLSDFEWGWAPFHYGRWRFDDYYGWEWIPDYEWGPAWVDWRSGGGYYGWAPLTPGISIDLAFGGGYNIPSNYWNFAPYAYINSPNVYNYYVPRARVMNIIRNTAIINNTYSYNGGRYITGPRRQDIERYTHNRVTVYNINNANRPSVTRVQNNTVNIYRPIVNKVPDARPSRVVDARAYRDANPDQRIAGGNGANINHNNAARLANFARTAPADNRIVRDNRPDNRNSYNRNNGNTPAVNPNNPINNGNNGRTNVPRTDGQPTPVTQPGQPIMNDRQTRQQGRGRYQGNQQQQQNGQQQVPPQQPPVQQPVQQQQNQQHQQDDQQRRQRPPVNQQGQTQNPQQQQVTPPQDAQRQQQQQTWQQARQQQQDAQRQQQQGQQRQQDDQQRRQRPSVDQQQQQARQQQDAQRQQQQGQQQQQQARQQQDAQRQQQQGQQQQQQARQQQDAQRQQQQQAQQQSRQQQDAQRQQQQQARQQQEQQRQQRQQEDQKKNTPPMR